MTSHSSHCANNSSNHEQGNSLGHGEKNSPRAFLVGNTSASGPASGLTVS
jgi:hypothetical protein